MCSLGFLKASSSYSAVPCVRWSQDSSAAFLGIGWLIRADPSIGNKILCLFSLIKYPPYKGSRWSFLLVWEGSISHPKKRKGIVQTRRMSWELAVLLLLWAPTRAAWLQGLWAPARAVWLLGVCQGHTSSSSWGSSVVQNLAPHLMT